MLIECSFCHATAKIPEDKEGAKVRCSECGKVYVAREKGSRKKASGVNPATLWIGGGAVVLIALIAFMANRKRAPAPPPKPVVVAKEPEPQVDMIGWDSESVKAVRAVYDAAFAVNEAALVNMLDGAKIAKRVSEAKPDAPVDWDALDAAQKQAFLAATAQELMRGEDEHAPHKWKAVDGKVVEPDLLDTTVRITADQRLPEGSTAIAESRTFDWKLSRPATTAKWKVWSWERFLSEDEKRLARAKKPKVTRVELDDGTKLFQAEMRHLDPYPDTPPETIAHIEKLMATMLDLNLTRESNRARDEIVALGRPAIPLLLNKFHEIKLVDAEDDPSLTQIMIVYETLRRITSYDPGFTAMPGQTEERRTMALKAYFAWWERKGKNFTEPPPPGKDLLEEMLQPTERDKREMEKEKAKTGGGR